MKKYAVLHEPGDIVTLAGTRFVVLNIECRPGGCEPDSLFLLSLETVGTSVFGISNNYAESDLKKAVDKWLGDMEKKGLDISGIPNRVINLNTVDGSGIYAGIKVKAAPLTSDEFRLYESFIPNAESYWLATGWSGEERSGDNCALYVSTDGDLCVGSCLKSFGVRPTLKIPSILFEDSEAGLDLSKIPTDDLLQEIRRRLAEKE